MKIFFFFFYLFKISRLNIIMQYFYYISKCLQVSYLSFKQQSRSMDNHQGETNLSYLYTQHTQKISKYYSKCSHGHISTKDYPKGMLDALTVGAEFSPVCSCQSFRLVSKLQMHTLSLSPEQSKQCCILNHPRPGQIK